MAAIDCGTNSIRLLIAEVDLGRGRLTPLARHSRIVRLGYDIDATGLIDDGAMRYTLAAVDRYARICDTVGVDRIRFVATSAVRDAANRDDFFAGVQDRLAVEPEVLSGAQEARLSFLGATRVLAPAASGSRFTAPTGAPEPWATGSPGGDVLVVDLGGGSTEVALGSPGGEVFALSSVDVGSVRLTERHAFDDPPTAHQLRAASRDVDAALDQVAAAVPLERTGTLIGVAGSVITITAHALQLPDYDSQRVHGAALPADAVLAACQDLLAMTQARRRLALPYLDPARADVIAAGALIWAEVVGRVRAAAGIQTVITSEWDILDAVAWSLGQAPPHDGLG